MASISQAQAVDSSAASLREKEGPKFDWTLWGLVVASLTVLLAAGGISGLPDYYTPGSSFGYSLGVTGAVMMLALLLYPLRKNVRAMQRLGPAKYWFWAHMFLGVAGPITILFHCTFQAHSLNALVALLAMLLVALSGAVGRFGYSKIHYGLDGRHKTLEDLKAAARISSSDVTSKFYFAPDVERRLRDFELYAVQKRTGLWGGFWRFLTLGWRGKIQYVICAITLHRLLGHYAEVRGWDEAKLQRRRRNLLGLARLYLTAVQDVAQFRVYERLFSLWHYLHIPLFFMLVVSAIAHVVAVHMY